VENITSEEVDAQGQVKYFVNNSLGIIRDGRLVRMWGTQTDITERRKAEAEREKLVIQLQQAQKMESVGRLAGGVAHDFNNMLGVILGYTDLSLAKMEADHPLARNLVQIRKAAERSANLTRQLLAFARKQTVAPRILDINAVVAGMMGMLERLIGENIELVWTPGDGVWPVLIDPSQVDQILANLCVNSRDAIADKGRITIETRNIVIDAAYALVNSEAKAGEYICLSVGDNGCGMDKETQGHLFEPFFTTKAPGKGTGLGLATLYGIVRQNNGFINVSSWLGQGTVVKVYLPRHHKALEVSDDLSAVDSVPLGQGTVLVTEDEPAILELTGLMLQQLGYRVLSAATPGQAIEIARMHPGKIDLLITDVVMPEMNGRDLAKNLLSLYPHLRRLFMSGYTADVIAHHGVLDEGVNFIQKPFTIDELAARVAEVMKTGRGGGYG
jgi:signal transduction histidine kinase/CheY-like chemotaxis protein